MKVAKKYFVSISLIIAIISLSILIIINFKQMKQVKSIQKENNIILEKCTKIEENLKAEQDNLNRRKKDLVGENNELNNNINNLIKRLEVEKRGNEEALQEVNNLKEERSSLESKIKECKEEIKPVYIDPILEESLIEVILTHFEAIREKDKELYLSTVDLDSQKDYLLAMFNRKEEYIEKIYYNESFNDDEVSFPEWGFFVKVKPYNIEYPYYIAVYKKNGKWKIYDYD